MRRTSWTLLLFLLAACSHFHGGSSTASTSAASANATPAPQAAAEPTEPSEESGDEEDAEDADAPDESGEGTGPVAEEQESHDVATPGENVIRYTKNIPDDVLQQKWKGAPEELGCMSLGFADEGRLINARQFPKDNDWIVVSPERAWGTEETINYVRTAVKKVKSLHPNAPPLRINQISAKEGGYLRPHKSHQNGRDVDLGLYYPTVDPIRTRAREKVIDVALTWELLKAIVTETDVQLVLVDKHIQKTLHGYALKAGEDKAWVDKLFSGQKHALIQHARHHRDHFHVRFFNPIAQELGRRISPLLAQRPEQNVAMHRVHSGDNLGAIARKYKTSVAAIQKANHMHGSFLKLAQVLKVPLRGPCTKCPIPAPITLPARFLPPAVALASSAAPAPPASTVGEPKDPDAPAGAVVPAVMHAAPIPTGPAAPATGGVVLATQKIPMPDAPPPAVSPTTWPASPPPAVSPSWWPAPLEPEASPAAASAPVTPPPAPVAAAAPIANATPHVAAEPEPADPADAPAAEHSPVVRHPGIAADLGASGP